MTPEQQRAAKALLRSSLSGGLRPTRELAKLLAGNGHDVALVGGPVRDAFLGRPYGDLDLTTDALPEQVMEITKEWADSIWPVGLKFGTVGLRKGKITFEITTYRSEHYEPESRKPDVRYETSLTADLSRRDFTVNAMAAHLPGLDLVDPFGGLADLRHKILRTPGRAVDSFNDDPLRILRAARFVAQLGLTPTKEVREAMAELAPRLTIVSSERIAVELEKLLQADRPGGPSAGIDLLVQTGVAEQILPEVPKMRLEVDEHHRHKDVYRHSLTVLDQVIALEGRYGLEGDLRLRLAALLHDIGKPKTRSLLQDGRVAFHHHDTVGAKLARNRLRSLRFPNDVTEDVAKLIGLHLRFHGFGSGDWTDSAVRRYVTDAGPLLPRLHALTRADCTTRNKAKAERLSRSYDALERRIAELEAQEELARIRPDLDGNEIMALLGIPPGPTVGDAYTHLLELRMEHGPLGHDRAVQELLRWARESGLPTAEAAEPGAGSAEPGEAAEPDGTAEAGESASAPRD
ncbi:MAG TPA: CCA tRNA nucleotidyltransferase [Streptosporangiaceae bacterium]|nr:CCA tRNA nucleotidyltransferase [Streptosporangiaceae bacterium]